jgi:uncharacterized damage-inducible protein DinB
MSELSEPILSAADLLAWNETTTQNWRKLLSSHPELLHKPCDVADTKTIAELLQHIVAVELRYAQRIADLPITDYSELPFDSVDSIFATHTRAIALFQQSLAAGTNWNEEIDFPTRSRGRLRSTRKTILFHALLHSIRHYAQLATLVRQCGIKPDWPMDYLFMHMKPAQ